MQGDNKNAGRSKGKLSFIPSHIDENEEREDMSQGGAAPFVIDQDKSDCVSFSAIPHKANDLNLSPGGLPKAPKIGATETQSPYIQRRPSEAARLAAMKTPQPGVSSMLHVNKP